MEPDPHDKHEPDSKRRQFFGGLFARLFDRDAPAPARDLETTSDSGGELGRLERELAAMSDRAEARIRESAVRRRSAAVAGGPSTSDERERFLAEREEARSDLQGDISRLHRQFGTGIDDDELGRLRRLLSAHAPDAEPSRGERIEERIERSVLIHLFRRAAREAWDHFESLVEHSGLVWPIPEGLPETAAPELFDHVRERHQEEIRAAFLGASPQQLADAIQGEVRAWVYSYPDKHSYLWLLTALRGVAAALCAQFFAAALEVWMWRTGELERQLLAAASDELKAPRLLLKKGIQSLSEAVDVASQVDRVCESVIPSLVWSFVSPKLKWVRAGEAAPSISVLARGLSQIDPVCGMSLTPERVAARSEYHQRIVYFCSAACRRLFEAAPFRFSPAERSES